MNDSFVTLQPLATVDRDHSMCSNPMGNSQDSDPRIAFFNRIAPDWDTNGQDPDDTVRQLEEFADLLRLQPGNNLLEVGCGTGQITGWLARQVAPGQVVAVDFAETMLTQAKKKDIPAKWHHADVCRDDLGQSCFDVVLCFHSFPHFADQAAAVTNLARTLRPNGRFLVMHLAGSAQINAFHDEVGGEVAGDHLPCTDKWESLLAANNLSVRNHIDRDGLFFLEAVLDSNVQ